MNTGEERRLSFLTVRALSTCYLSTGSTSMKVHDRLGRQSYAAVERRVVSCQVAKLFPRA